MRSTFDRVCALADELSKLELHRLQDFIKGLIDVKEIIDVRPEIIREVRDKQKANEGKRGYLEKKMIRGFGPYYYLRYWSGGKLKSQYLGKKQDILSRPVSS